MKDIGGRGAFITIEGGEGGGKSTQTHALVARLEAAGLRAEASREPGGSPAAEDIRSALLAGSFERLGPKIEALLFAAARIDHLEVKIKPAMAAGTWIVCDRFHDSTKAYQGAHGGADMHFLQRLERVTLDGLRPDLTLVLDLPAELGLARAESRRGTDKIDRFEKQSLAFHQSLRDAFLTIAKEEPERCIVVDASRSRSEVEQAIWDAVTHRLALPSRPS